MATTSEQTNRLPAAGDSTERVRRTAAILEGLDALQREYQAFVESSFQTLAVIANRRLAK